MGDLKERLDTLIRTEQTGSRKLMQVGIDALDRIEQLEAQLKAAKASAIEECAQKIDELIGSAGTFLISELRTLHSIGTATTGAKTP